jgi:histidinol-phosphate aminotransferase
VKGLPKRVLLVLDSAYAEYLEADARFDPGHRHVTAHPGRVIVLRTFSKLYALAALRVGWLHAAPLAIEYLRRARFIFPVTTPSQAAAIAALGDRTHAACSMQHNATWRPFLEQQLAEAGVEVLPSGANFVLARFPAGQVAAADGRLRADGLLARVIPSLDGLRISVGLEADNRAVVDALKAR